METEFRQHTGVGTQRLQAPLGRKVPRAHFSATTPRLRTLSIGVVALVFYLFVVHSYKLGLGAVALAIGLFGVVLHERPIRGSQPLYWFAAYLTWALVTLPASTHTDLSLSAWIASAKLFLIMFLALNSIRNRNQHRFVTLAWLAMFAFYPVRGTLFNFIGGYSTAGRYAWNFLFGNFNDMAALTLIPFAMSIERLRSTDKIWVRACALVGVISLPFIILITQSRAGMLGLAIMIGYIIVRSKFRVRMLVAVGAIGIMSVMFAPKAVWDRIVGMKFLTSTETLGQSDSSAEQRYLIWQVAGAIIADNPIAGVGIGSYGQVHREYAQKRVEWAFARGARDTHSTYLHLLAETGFIGFGLFLMIFVSAGREMVRTARELKGSNNPDDMRLREVCQTFFATYLGLAVCGVFGSLETVAFPFLFAVICSTAVWSSDNPRLHRA